MRFGEMAHENQKKIYRKLFSQARKWKLTKKTLKTICSVRLLKTLIYFSDKQYETILKQKIAALKKQDCRRRRRFLYLLIFSELIAGLVRVKDAIGVVGEAV